MDGLLQLGAGVSQTEELWKLSHGHVRDDTSTWLHITAEELKEGPQFTTLSRFARYDRATIEAYLQKRGIEPGSHEARLIHVTFPLNIDRYGQIREDEVEKLNPKDQKAWLESFRSYSAQESHGGGSQLDQSSAAFSSCSINNIVSSDKMQMLHQPQHDTNQNPSSSFQQQQGATPRVQEWMAKASELDKKVEKYKRKYSLLSDNIADEEPLAKRPFLSLYDWASRNRRLEEEVTELKTNVIGGLQQEKKSLEAKIRDMELDKESQDRKLDKMRSELSNYAIEQRSKDEQVKVLEKHVIDLKASKSANEETIKRLELELSESKAEEDGLSEQVRRLKSLQTKQTDRISELQTATSAAQQELMNERCAHDATTKELKKMHGDCEGVIGIGS